MLLCKVDDQFEGDSLSENEEADDKNNAEDKEDDSDDDLDSSDDDVSQNKTAHCLLLLHYVGHGGALVESIAFNRRVVGSTPALAAM